MPLSETHCLVHPAEFLPKGPVANLELLVKLLL